MAKYDGIDFTPPKGVQEAAQRGLDLREKWGRGGTDVGVARARDLSNGKDMSPDTIGRMVSFFARHMAQWDRDKKEDDGGPTAQTIAILLWGGDPGDKWSSKVYEQMQRADKATENAEGDRRTFLIFRWGEVVHANGDFTVDREFFEAMRTALRDLRADGYAPPILRNHNDEEGLNFGRWLDIIATEEGIKAVVEFAKGMAQKFDDGYLDSWSPSFWPEWEHSTSGKYYRFAPRELSFVGVKHLKNVPGASPHYGTYALRDEDCDWVPLTKLMKEVSMSEAPKARPDVELQEGEDEEMSMKELMEAVANMGKRIDELSEKIAAMEAPEDEEEAEMKCDTEYSENNEVKALQEQIELMESVNAVMDELGCKREEARGLAKLKRFDIAMYKQHVALREQAAKAAEPTSLSESGAPGLAPKTGKMTYEEVKELAEAKGLKPGPERVKFMKEKAPHLF